MKIQTVFLFAIFSICSLTSWGQTTWELTSTMTATLDDEGVLTISTTLEAEAMPDFHIIDLPPWDDFSSNIHSIVIEDKVATIGDNAFVGFENLISVSIPNSVQTIGWGAFSFCIGLKSVTIPSSVTTIGNGAFAFCTDLSSVTIPNSVTTIEDYAFQNCESLTDVMIPNSVTEIGDAVFGWCTSLKSIEVEEGNTTYSSAEGVLYNKDKTFLHTYPAGKSNISFVIPNTVETIKNASFRGCENLFSITIPNSVTEIGEYAFQDCTGLNHVTVGWATPLSISSNYFVFPWEMDSNSPPELVINMTLHVPPETKSLYQAEPLWGIFKTINETAVVSEETQPASADGKGNISLSLYIPSDLMLTGSFEIQFPEGIILDEELTALSSELAGSLFLSITPKGNNTWFVEIEPNALRSASASDYWKIIDIAYNVTGNIPDGSYEATITNLDFTMNDGTPIKEDLLTVIVRINQNPSAVENILNKQFNACFVGNTLRVESPQAESIAIYSLTGTLLYSTVKEAGAIDIPVSYPKGSILILKGSKSGTLKVIKQQ